MKWIVLSLQLLFCLYIGSSCERPSEAQTIVDAAIERHGGEKLENTRLSFDFRDRHYTYSKENGLYRYTRSFTDSAGRQIEDELSNEGFSRAINGEKITLPQERVKAFSNSVNSVIYFALLPYGLNDPSVNKTLLGQTELEGEPYHLVKVTFDQDGGGEDFEDEFLYWIHQKEHTLDYLAYSYKTEGGGVRFRKAINPQDVGGIRFQDYINYKPAGDQKPALENMEELYKKGQLEVLSEIVLENIAIASGDNLQH